MLLQEREKTMLDKGQSHLTHSTFVSLSLDILNLPSSSSNESSNLRRNLLIQVETNPTSHT